MIRVFEYGCFPPLTGEAEAVEQMRRRNRLWNALVEVDNNIRTKAGTVLSDEAAQKNIEDLQKLIADQRAEIKKRRQIARSKKVDVEDLKAGIAAAKEQLSIAIATEREAKKSRVLENKLELDRLNDLRKVENKKAVHEAGLYWCNYDDVLNSYKVAKQKKTPLRFHGWRGEGKVSVRYQTGMPVKEVFGTDTRLQIRKADPDEIRRGFRDPKGRWYIVSLRVGSREKANPVWLKLPVVLHRPMPEDGSIRSAAVMRNIVGGQARYRLVITVNDGKEMPSKPETERICAVDVGWRRVPEGLRVAYWVDHAGMSGSVVIDEREMLHEFEKCRDLQSIIDKRFEDIKKYITLQKPAWRFPQTQASPESQTPAPQSQDLPDTVPATAPAPAVMGLLPAPDLRPPPDLPALGEELATIGQWRSPGRLVRWIRSTTALGWRNEELDAWLKKQRHLYEWVSNLRDQVGRRRRELYRVFASRLARDYETVILEEFDLRNIAEKPEAEEATRVYATRARFIASISELRLAVTNTCQREGTKVVKVDAMYTTRDCNACGAKLEWESATSVIHRCEKCNKVWDQDHNAALNLLAKFQKVLVPA